MCKPNIFQWYMDGRHDKATRGDMTRMQQKIWTIMFIIIFGVIGCSHQADVQDYRVEDAQTRLIRNESFSRNDQMEENKILDEKDKNEEKVEPTSLSEKIAIEESGEVKLKKLFLPQELSELRQKHITHIVLHFTSNAAINPKNPYDVADIRKTFIDYGVSAHYLIGRKGQVYQLVPEKRVA